MLSVLAVFVTYFDFGFPHGLSIKVCAVCVVDEAVENGVCEGGFADHVVPCVDGQLAGDGLVTVLFRSNALILSGFTFKCHWAFPFQC